MADKFLDKLKEYSDQNKPFAVATVISTEGSASAVPGSKALFDEDGKMIIGWIGGGCAQSETRHAALEAIGEGKPRIIKIDLDDELLGAGMPCGGMMDVYVEPYLMKQELLIVGRGRIAETLAKFGSILGFTVTVNDSLADKEAYPTADNLINTLDYDEMEITSNTFVIVATQHKGDHKSLKRALSSKSPYIALIASKKRTELTFQYILEEGVDPSELKRIKAPAGLDLGGAEPEEIALSIISEIVATQNNGSGKTLMEVKGTRIPDLDVSLKNK